MPPAHPLMRRVVTALICSVVFAIPAGLAAAPSAPAIVPPAEHIIVIIMENKNYDQVRTAPFTASVIDSGSSFSASYGVTHPSQPNYLALWSGGTQGVTNDACPPYASPYATENLGHACEAGGVSWRAYSEGLPAAGSAVCTASGTLYVRKHEPWVNFSNLTHSNERPYADLAADIAAGTLPALAFVIPDQCHNTHDCPVATGDAWLAANLPAMIDAVGPNGYVVLTWDEDDYASGNHILTVFAGGLVQRGIISGRTINHYTVLSTLCASLGLAPFGAASLQAPITDIWNLPNTSVPDGIVRAPALGEARPNPSTGAFAVPLSLPFPSQVDAAVYDVAGRRVAVLLSGRRSGDLTLRWSGERADGRRAPAGLYFLRVRAEGSHFVRKLISAG